VTVIGGDDDGEFDHQNRAPGFDTWVSLTISNPTPAPPMPLLIHK